MPGIPTALASLGVSHGGMAAAAAAASRLGFTGLTPTAGHNVLLVSNLNPQVSLLLNSTDVSVALGVKLNHSLALFKSGPAQSGPSSPGEPVLPAGL